jgi:hypothetical protein
MQAVCNRKHAKSSLSLRVRAANPLQLQQVSRYVSIFVVKKSSIKKSTPHHLPPSQLFYLSFIIFFYYYFLYIDLIHTPALSPFEDTTFPLDRCRRLCYPLHRRHVDSKSPFEANSLWLRHLRRPAPSPSTCIIAPYHPSTPLNFPHPQVVTKTSAFVDTFKSLSRKDKKIWLTK